MRAESIQVPSNMRSGGVLVDSGEGNEREPGRHAPTDGQSKAWEPPELDSTVPGRGARRILCAGRRAAVEPCAAQILRPHAHAEPVHRVVLDEAQDGAGFQIVAAGDRGPERPLERAIALEPVTVTDDGPRREVVFVQGHEPGAARSRGAGLRSPS